MPTLNRAPNEKEVQKRISTYLKAETDIINGIGRRRSQGIFICFWGCTAAVHSVFICNEQYYRSETGNGEIACSHDFSAITDDNGIYRDDDALSVALRKLPSPGSGSDPVPDCWAHTELLPIKNYAIQPLTPIQCTLIFATEGIFCAVLSVILLHDFVTVQMCAAVLLILAGIMIEQMGETLQTGSV